MAFDAEAAKADGYTDEEIQAYLAAQNTPTPAQTASAAGVPVPTVQPIDRSAEYLGMTQGMGLKGLETAAELYAGKKLVVDPVLNAIRNRGAPTPMSPAEQTFNTLRTPPEVLNAPPVGGPAAQQGSTFIQRMTSQFAPMAARVAPVLSGLNKALPAAQVGMGLFYTSPEEMATLRAAEARRRQQGQ